jgi:sugar phosphate isomerase/epimerase
MAYRFSGREVKIGLQLWSIREQCARDLPGGLARVAEMGYQGVEFAGYHDHTAAEIRRQLDGVGLVCCGSHTQLETLQDGTLAETVEFNRVLGNPYLICPFMELQTIAQWRSMAARFALLAERLEPQGAHVGYHNHAHDFAVLEGQTPWHVFFDGTSPRVLMQVDSGNAMSGGADPVALIRRYPGRSPTVHVKDYARGDANPLIGEGELDWHAYLSACVELGGCRWLIVEIENPRLDSMEAAGRCLRNLTRLLE